MTESAISRSSGETSATTLENDVETNLASESMTLPAYLETDHFCGECGYNLNGQRVWRDERLSILVCRCPECGQHHPASWLTRKPHTWLRRFHLLLLSLWALGVVATLCGLLVGMGALAMETIHDLTEPSGDLITYTTGSGATYSYRSGDQRAPSPRAFERPLERVGGFYIASCGLSFLWGCCLVVFLWHWRRWKYSAVAVSALLAAGLIPWLLWNATYDSWGWGWQLFAFHTVLQMFFSMLGIMFGRSMVRVALIATLPPRALQVFAFLWRVDGKTVPPMPSDSR